MSADRRLGSRVPVELYLSAYEGDRLHRAVALNLSDSGMFVEQAAGLDRTERDTFGLEFELPGVGETIWAAGTLAGQRHSRYVLGRALRFTGIARAHLRLVRDYCEDLHQKHLSVLLERIRMA